MKRPSSLLRGAVLALLPLACGPGVDPDATGPTQIDPDNPTIAVSGRAEVFPEAVNLLSAQGEQSPALEGLTLTLEEPLGKGVNDANAVLGEGGGFNVPDVAVKGIHLSLAAHLEHTGFVPSSTILFDTVFTRTRPTTDLYDTRAWAVPDAFHDALTRAVGESTLRTRTDGRAGTLRDAGFILGRVVDAEGKPREGARVVGENNDVTARIYYPSADLHGTTQQATSSTGLFLYVHSAEAPDVFGLAVKGEKAYFTRNVGAATGRVLVVTFYPSDATP